MQTKDIRPTKAENVTEAVIAGWKKDHPRGVWKMTVYAEDGDESKTGYFRKPSRVELASAASIKNDPMGIAEGLLRDSFLGGDEELLSDDDYFQGALEQFQELMQVRRGEIKKL